MVELLLAATHWATKSTKATSCSRNQLRQNRFFGGFRLAYATNILFVKDIQPGPFDQNMAGAQSQTDPAVVGTKGQNRFFTAADF